MDHKDYKRILKFVSFLPKKIVTLHSLDNAPEFILHGLCHKNCFDLPKAAYFVDNPDFNVFKGVAGYSKDEEYEDWDKMWEHPEVFSSHMKKSAFNNKVRSYLANSSLKDSHSHDNLVELISNTVGFEQPAFCCWNMKHDNHGLLIYEKKEMDNEMDEFLTNSLHLLGFCPIF